MFWICFVNCLSPIWTSEQARSSFCSTNAVSVDIAYQKSSKNFIVFASHGTSIACCSFLVGFFACTFSIHHDLDLWIQFPANIWYFWKVECELSERVWVYSISAPSFTWILFRAPVEWVWSAHNTHTHSHIFSVFFIHFASRWLVVVQYTMRLQSHHHIPCVYTDYTEQALIMRNAHTEQVNSTQWMRMNERNRDQWEETNSKGEKKREWQHERVSQATSRIKLNWILTWCTSCIILSG